MRRILCDFSLLVMMGVLNLYLLMRIIACRAVASIVTHRASQIISGISSN